MSGSFSPSLCGKMKQTPPLPLAYHIVTIAPSPCAHSSREISINNERIQEKKPPLPHGETHMPQNNPPIFRITHQLVKVSLTSWRGDCFLLIIEQRVT